MSAPQICTESDYQAALAELEQLWGSENGTPEGDRLDVLAALIDAYEALHDPMGGRSSMALKVPNPPPRSRPSRRCDGAWR